MRPIDANTLKAEFTGNFQNEYAKAEIHALIDLAPTIGGWISVKDSLPEEMPSIFNSLYGTEHWRDSMWRMDSRKVIVAITLPDRSRIVNTARTHDGEWYTDVARVLNPVVTHWMPLPELPEE